MTGTDAQALRDQIARFDPTLPVEDAWTPPSSWYTDPELHALELRFVFDRAWQPVARLEQLAAAGAYVSGCMAGEPWVIARGSDDQLRALANTCRHRGREVVSGHGTAEHLVCGYHAWSYDLDGRLRSAPRMAGIRGFDRDQLSLPPLAVTEWGPWAWLSLDADPAPLLDRIASLDHMLANTRWGELRFHSRASWTLPCNWKVYVDNYLDGGYHIPHMHPSLDAQVDMSTYRTDLYGEFSVQTVDPAPGPDARTAVDPSERIGAGAIYAWIYPNFMLNRYGPCLDTTLVIPLGPDRCRVDYEFYFLPAAAEADPTFVAQSIEQAAVTQREDIEICTSVQVGLRSRHFDVGRYAPRVEHGEHHFHRRLAADLRRAVGLE
ncbi:MAG: aromatic ring-hydroxylating dioxygenase subunit alpha [Myxococcales bacterium]|nr:aromatic ring-hydroxylating dioxygenase subunit alpha [Myxococcales bacterium]